MGIRYVGVVTEKVLVFIIKHPSSAMPVFKFVVAKLHTIPDILYAKTHTDEEGVHLRLRLLQCAELFDEIASHYDAINIDVLKLNEDSYNHRWVWLYLLIRAIKPAIVVETGVAAGISSSHILKALCDNGSGFLHSVDLPNQLERISDGKIEFAFNPPGGGRILDSRGIETEMELTCRKIL